MDRRTALGCLAGAVAANPVVFRSANAAESEPRTGLGLVLYNCGIRRRWLQRQQPGFDLFEPLTFLKHVQSLGAGGMQASLGVLTPEQIRDLRDFANRHSLFIDAIIRPPSDNSDLARFEAEIQSAAAVQVQAARTVIMPGRRYEQFKSLDEFRAAAVAGEKMLERAAPIVERHRVRLAVENHKDQRINERIGLFQRLNSEFIGACLDTGNSFALLDDPYGTIEALAPHSFTVHLKDQALRETPDGFLLGDIPLGEGSFDLTRMVQIIRTAQPDIRFSLELITRDALKVPCLTEPYWTTLPTVNGQDLVRTMQFVRKHPSPAMQEVSSLTESEQLALEDANVAASLRYAREKLGL